MCPFYPFHAVIIYLLSLIPVWVLCQSAPKLLSDFDPNKIEVHMESLQRADINVTSMSGYKENDTLQIFSDNPHIASTNFETYKFTTGDIASNYLAKPFNVTGNFLGKTRVKAKVCTSENVCSTSDNDMDVVVTRKERVIDRIFTGSVATLVSIIYINFGCALDWPTVKETVRRPVGPVIGFFTQFVFMPLISFGFGKLLFPESVEMQLGMFFTGVSPGGGASNIWTYVLGGNLNLSIAMTTISTFAAFGMMPFWLFTLGRAIFKSGDMGVPYSRIAGFALGLIIPLGLGLLMQKYLPRVAKLMVRILKTFSGLLLIFIIVFAIVTNLYLFELFSWKIVIAGMCVPWLGYLCGYIAAYCFKRPPEDRLAIAIETGIQNTGIAIFLLRFSLSQPEADLTTVIPVSIAIMTPIPMIGIYIYQLISRKFFGGSQKEVIPETNRSSVEKDNSTDDTTSIEKTNGSVSLEEKL